MKNKHRPKLTPAEVSRLVNHIAANGTQEDIAVSWGTTASTLSRSIHGHSSPGRLLRHKLIEVGVVLKK